MISTYTFYHHTNSSCNSKRTLGNSNNARTTLVNIRGAMRGALSPRPQLLEGLIIISYQAIWCHFALVIQLLEGNYLLPTENQLLIMNHLKFHPLFYMILNNACFQIASIFTKTLPNGETFSRDWLNWS